MSERGRQLSYFDVGSAHTRGICRHFGGPAHCALNAVPADGCLF